MADIQFEDIVPWGQTGGDTGLSSRLKLKRNFGKIKTWIDSMIIPRTGPFTIWGQTYWQNGQPQNVSGSLDGVEDIYMSGKIVFNDNSRIYEDSSRRLRLMGYAGIQADHNLLLGTDLAIKTAAVGENGTDLLAYKSGDWGGVTGAHWFVGVAGVDGFIRSDGELKRWANNENQYTIWDSSNLTPSNYLQLTGGTLKGTLTFADSNGNAYGAIRAEKIGNDEYLYLWGNDGVLIDGLSVRKDNAIVPIEDVFLNLTGGTMEPGATITLQEIENNIPIQTLVASQRWVNAQGFLTSHQSLANYVTLDGTETITGQKTFGGIVNLQSDVYVTPTGTLYLQTYDSASRPVSSPAASQSWVSSQGFLTSHQSLANYATTSQLNNGLAAKQNKIHFLNRNNNDTESDFSYLYLPLMNVNSGYAELDVLPLSGGSMTGDIDMQTNYLRFSYNSWIHDDSGTLEIYGYDGITMNKRPTVRTGADKYANVALETDVYECLEGGTAAISSTAVEKQSNGMTYSRTGDIFTLNGNRTDSGAIILRVNFAATGTAVVKVTITPSSEGNYDFGAVGLPNENTLSSGGGATASEIKDNVRTVLAKTSGTTAVTAYFTVKEGSNFIEICYAKDSSSSSGNDTVTVSFETFGYVSVNGGTMKGDLNLDVNKLVFQNGYIENTTQDGGYMHFLSKGGQFHFHGVSGAYGTCVAAAFTQQSDARLKDVTRQLTPRIEDIAAAPIIAFRWKGGDGNENLGTLAQYWQSVLPQAVHEDADGFLSVEYGTIALASAVTAARKVMDLERRVALLESR